MANKIDLRKRISLSICLLVIILTTGTIGYSFIEGWSLFDSFYMTLITLTTIGYQEVHLLSREGRIFNIFMIIIGISIVGYTANYVFRFVLEGEIQHIIGRRKMEKVLEHMKDHYIVCGFGRMGRIICNELKSGGVPLLVIEQDRREHGISEEIPIIIGDATRDEILKEARIESAKGLISVLSSDANNLYVVLSARGLNHDLQIIARAGDEGAEKKLLRAGADRVMSPYHIGGLRIAHSVLKPSIVEFMEFATGRGNLELKMEEITINKNSKLAGVTLEQSNIGNDLGVIIVAIKKGNEMKFNPTFRTVIDAKDILIALGDAQKLKKLEMKALG